MKILRPVLESLFGVTNRSLHSAIQNEIANGAVFEKFVFPLPCLKEICLIQMVGKTPNGTVIAGLGSDESEAKAYRKAAFEYFERKCFWESGVAKGFTSTNGLAAHRYFWAAKMAAANELFERDAFLRHWYTRTSFLPISADENSLALAAAGNLSKDGFELHLKETYLGEMPTVACFIVSHVTGGFVLGLSSGRKRKGNIEKAIVEAATNLYFNEKFDAQNANELARLRAGRIQDLDDHRAYWMHASRLPAWVLDKCLTAEPRQVPQSEPAVEFVCLGRKPVPVAGAYSRDLLPLVIGRFEDWNAFGLQVEPQQEELIHPIP